jgi:hypothetical protein
MIRGIFAFNSGEWSPRLEARADLEKYGTAARRIENFVPMPYGGVERRAGFQFVAACKHSDKKTRLIDFRFSVSTNFIIELADLAIRFFSNGLQVESGGSPVEVTSPYLEAELFAIQRIQVKDVIRLVHPNHEPRLLKRVTDTSWTLTKISASWDTGESVPPFREENITATTITPSGTSGAITLTASADTFETGHVGSYWQVSHQRATGIVTQAITATGTSSTILVRGNVEFETTQTWTATVTVEQSLDNGSTWELKREFVSNADFNARTTIYIDKTSLLRINITAWTSQSGGAKAYLRAESNFTHGICKITARTSATVVDATVVGNALLSTNATKYWNEAAWSDHRGWPRSVELHESRVFYGGTADDKALTVWGSVLDDFDNFQSGTNDDDAVEFTLASAQNNQIQWLASQARTLVIGTGGGEWTMQSRNQDSPITPTNVVVRLQSRYGCAQIAAELLNDSLFFVQRANERVIDWRYVFADDGFAGRDVSILAEHIVESDLSQLAQSQQPWAMLWGVNGDGELTCMTYERQEEVLGWSRHTTDGTIESVATIPGTFEDEVWISVKRTIDGGTVRYVERMEPSTRENALLSDPVNCLFLDSGLVIDNGGTPATAITAAHLANEAVTVLVDGSTHPAVTLDANGDGTLEWAGDVVMVGMPMTSVVEIMPIVQPLEGGSTYGRIGRANKAIISLNRSIGGQHSTRGHAAPDDRWTDIRAIGTDDNMDEPAPVFTGVKEVTLEGHYDRLPTVAIRQKLPLPLTVRSIAVMWDSSQQAGG